VHSHSITTTSEYLGESKRFQRRLVGVLFEIEQPLKENEPSVLTALIAHAGVSYQNLFEEPGKKKNFTFAVTKGGVFRFVCNRER